MGKIKTKARSNSGRDILRTTSARVGSNGTLRSQSKSTEELMTEAARLLEQSQSDAALSLIDEVLARLEAEREHYGSPEALFKQSADGKPTFPEALVLGAEIYLSAGDVDRARSMFVRAADIDGDGLLVSAEPWLWLAQLSEEGGRQSIQYFEKAVEVLSNETEVLEENNEEMQGEEKLRSQQVVEERRAKWANALCGMAEIYMTDLSWESDAESRCEGYVTEAVAICPENLSAGVLQTLASVRISQQKIEDARQALARSMLIWKDLPEDVESSAKPDFPTRVSLARLLMEVEAEPEAMFVIEGLVKDDDQSVESLYLGGWCQVILSQKIGISAEEKSKHEEQARLWLGNCLKLYAKLDYEDDRLQAHARELVNSLNTSLGIADDDDEWEDADEDDVDDEANEEIEVDAGDQDDPHDKDVEMT